MSLGVILATASYDHTIRLWEAPSGICYRQIQFSESQVNCLTVSPDRLFLVAGANPHLRWFDLHSKNPQPVASFDGHTGNVMSIGFQRDGRWMFSASDDKTIRLWDTRTNTMQLEFKHDAPINSAQLHARELEIFAGDQDGNARVWDLRSRLCSNEITPDRDTAIRCVSLSNDGRFALAATDQGTSFIWSWTHKFYESTPDPETNEGSSSSSSRGTEYMSIFSPQQRLVAHEDAYILRTCFSPDSRMLATCSSDKTVRLWRLDESSDTFEFVEALSGHSRWVWDCSFSADSAFLLTGSSDGTSMLWDLSTRKFIKTYSGHQKPVCAVCLDDRTTT